MISIFSDLVEQCMKIFVDDFYVFNSSFDDYLSNLSVGKVQGEKLDFELGEMSFHG